MCLDPKLTSHFQEAMARYLLVDDSMNFLLLSSKYIESISLDGVWQDRVIDVELTRMASEDIADRRRAFELFPSLKVRLHVTIPSGA